MSATFMDGLTAATKNIALTFDRAESKLHLLSLDDGSVIASWPRKEIRFEDSYGGPSSIIHLWREGVLVSARRDEIPAEFFQTSSRWAFPTFSSKSSRWLFVPLIVFAALAFAASFQTFPVVARSIAIRIPIEWEKKAADGLLDKFYQEENTIKGEPDLVVQKIVKRLIEKGPHEENVRSYRVVLSKDPLMNAFAVPGGLIILNCGLIAQAKSPDEVAGVLAHEMQHLISRHVLAGVIRALSFSAFWGVALGDFSGVTFMDPQTVLALASMKFSRADEEEADAGALKILNQADISTSGTMEFFDRLAKKESKFVQKTLSLLGTHPNTQSRALLFAGPYRVSSPPVLSESEWEILKTACRNEPK